MKTFLCACSLFALLCGLMPMAPPAMASDGVFTALDGQKVTATGLLHDGPLIACVFKTWCSTSVDALHRYERFQTGYAARDPHLHVLAVGQNPLAALKVFVSRQHLEGLTTVEEQAPFAWSRGLGARQTPTLMLVSTDGRLLASVSGWNRAEANAFSHKVADLTHLPYVEISRDGDGMPETKPGCVILETPELDN